MLLEAFKNSLYYLWFSNLSDELIQKVIDHVINDCDAIYIKRYCSRLYNNYIVLAVVKFIIDSNITETQNDQGQAVPVIQPLDASLLEVYVKKDVVRDVSREYFKPEIDPCKDCNDSPYGKLKADLQALLEKCRKSRSLLGGYGTNYGCRKSPGQDCAKDEYK